MNKSDEKKEALVLKNQLDLAALVHHQRLQSGVGGGKMPAQVLADKAGVSRDTIFRIERGEDVSFATAMRVLRVFGLGIHAAHIDWPTLHNANHYFQTEV